MRSHTLRTHAALPPLRLLPPPPNAADPTREASAAANDVELLLSAKAVRAAMDVPPHRRSEEDVKLHLQLAVAGLHVPATGKAASDHCGRWGPPRLVLAYRQ